MTWDDVFTERRRRKVGGGSKMTPADEIIWHGEFNGQVYLLRSRVRFMQAHPTFLVSSNARINFGWNLGPKIEALFEHFVDIEILLPSRVTDAALRDLARLAETVDTRPVVVRRKRAPLRAGLSA